MARESRVTPPESPHLSSHLTIHNHKLKAGVYELSKELPHSKHPMAEQFNLTIPTGESLGVFILKAGDGSGQCIVASKTNAASSIAVGDVILSMNGIILANVDGGVSAWVKLFAAFMSMPRNLVVQRSSSQETSTRPAPAIAVPRELQSAAATVKPSAVVISNYPPPPAQPYFPLPPAGLPTQSRPQTQYVPLPAASVPTHAAPAPSTTTSIALKALELAKSSKPSAATTNSIALKALELAKSSKPSESTNAAYAKARKMPSKPALKMPSKPQPKKHALKPSSHGNTMATGSNKKAKKSITDLELYERSRKNGGSLTKEPKSGRKIIKDWNHDDNYMKMMRDGFRECITSCFAFGLCTDHLSSQLTFVLNTCHVVCIESTS